MGILCRLGATVNVRYRDNRYRSGRLHWHWLQLYSKQPASFSNPFLLFDLDILITNEFLYSGTVGSLPLTVTIDAYSQGCHLN